MDDGCGLYDLLVWRVVGGYFSGIVNGIDVSWDLCCDIYFKVYFGIGEWIGCVINVYVVCKVFGLVLLIGLLFVVVLWLVY